MIPHAEALWTSLPIYFLLLSRESGTGVSNGMSKITYRVVFVLFAMMVDLLVGGTLQAQNLALEGETGVYITPLAYVAPSPANNFGKPAVAFHFLAAGNVIGNFSNISVTEGAFGRLEFGYTRDIHSTAGNPTLSPLWHDGFNILHGKVNIVRENAPKHNWLPAISTGFVVRTQVHNVGGAISNKDTTNGDVYIVATKTITQFKLPIILSGGVRGTNAELWGLAGNAPSFQALAFGAAGFMLRGPAKSVLIFATEVAQQPRHPEGLAPAVIPTTITYAMRVLPKAEGSKFNIDLGVAQIANQIMPGVDLKARHQFGMGVSYRF
jgi:hypothetical protein